MGIFFKALAHMAAAHLWSKVADVFIFTGNISQKRNSLRGMIMSGIYGHVACVKALYHAGKLEEIFDTIGAQ